ncbi:MAG: hypothetical protein WDA74_08725 [Spirochaetota bacterium]
MLMDFVNMFWLVVSFWILIEYINMKLNRGKKKETSFKHSRSDE